MIFTWEEKDIIAGQRYTSSPDKKFKIIGFLNRNHFEGERYVGVSLQDGFVEKAMTKKDFALKLTERNAQPSEWTGREHKE